MAIKLPSTSFPIGIFRKVYFYRNAFDFSGITARCDFFVKKSYLKKFYANFFCQIIPQLYYSCHHPLSAFSGNGGLRY